MGNTEIFRFRLFSNIFIFGLVVDIRKGNMIVFFDTRNKFYLTIRRHKLAKSTQNLTFFQIKTIFEFLTIFGIENEL